MAIRKIITWGDPRLKTESAPVGEWTPELEAFVQDLFDTCYDDDGVGLAAPQVGVNLQMAVVDPTGGVDSSQRLLLINPVIIHTEGSQVGQEGCLSVPGIHEVLERPKKVVVKNRRPDGSEYEVTGEDLLARILCHEIDHLHGKLFVEYFGPVKRQIVQKKYQKLRARQA